MKKLILVSLMLLASTVGAQATTITFDSLEQPGTGFKYLPSYSEDGYQLSASSFASAQNGNTGWYFGSASLFNNYGNGVTTLTKADHGTFSFNSIDLAPVSTGWGAGATVTFIGNVHGGGTVTDSYTLSNSYSFERFALTGFNELDSVSWIQQYNYHQFDNLVLEQSAPVPEPSTFILLGAGLVGTVCLKRKRSKA